MLEYLLVILLGLIIGSFLNAFIWRLHAGESIVKGRSHCTHCNHMLSAPDLIPVISYLALRGRCRYCQKSINIQYPLVELATASLFAFAFMQYQQGVFLASSHGALFALWLYISLLIVIFVYDLRWGSILDVISLPFIAGAFLLNVFLFHMPAMNLLLAAGVGAGFFTLQYLISKGAWIGDGDIRLGFLMGVLLGWPHILTGLFVSYMVGSIVSVGLLASQKTKLGSPIPFGPFLVTGTVLVFLFKPTFDWILQRLFL
ncbi:prepilin peptidase [Candidatus Uhrbacteria bacterium]|nr:prepilin peptidase [Candidatus Uhrbacteria bacterium]